MLAIADLLFRGIEVTLLLLAGLLFIPSAFLFLECLAALFPRRYLPSENQGLRPIVNVLVPAHNEAVGIGATLAAIQQQLMPEDRLFVVADNCDDATASVAHQTGATVIERYDLEHRGKGYALDYGLQQMVDEPPDVVVIVDADCLIGPNLIDHISRAAVIHRRPIQAVYLFQQPPKPHPKDAVSTLAITVKNLVRPLGLSQLGLPCLLGGTGMAFPWSAIAQVSLASGNIVEDMKLGLDLALANYPPMFCPTVQITGQLPQQERAAKSQRTRWEHGHLQTLLIEVPRLLRAAIRQRRLDLLGLALEVSVPPLSFLVLVWVASLVLALGLVWLGGSMLPVVGMGISGILIVTAVLLAWAKFCRTTLPPYVLLSIPLYVLWKIPLYIKFLVKPQTKWVRTERDSVQ